MCLWLHYNLLYIKSMYACYLAAKEDKPNEMEEWERKMSSLCALNPIVWASCELKVTFWMDSFVFVCFIPVKALDHQVEANLYYIP